MNKKKLLLFGIPIVLILVGYTLFGNTADEDVAVTTKVVKGDFVNEVIISGEAQSTSLKKMLNPNTPRNSWIQPLLLNKSGQR